MSKVVFVADLFANQFIGGAELTTEALIEACPFESIKVNAKDVTIETLQSYQDCFWVFGNFSQLNMELIPSIVGNIKYSVLEYDYKFCKYRSIEKHKHETTHKCDCHEQHLGKMVSAFYYGASKVFWMSGKQEDRYIERFPFLEGKGRVLGSVFSKDDLQMLQFLKTDTDKAGGPTLIQDSESWIKGTQEAVDFCNESGLKYEKFAGLSRIALLNKMATASAFCFLPRAGNTCPRVFFKVKILGGPTFPKIKGRWGGEAGCSTGHPDS